MLDWDAWFGWRGHRCAVATAQGQYVRGGAKSGEVTGGAGQCDAHRASRCPRGGARWVPGLGEQAEVRARQWLPGGGRGNSDSCEQAAPPSLHAGVQAQVVQEEGLGVLRRHWS
jgi:hypothetical protein